MAEIDELVGLLCLVEQSGGRIDTRIKIQKEAFLLAASNEGPFSLSNFSYHHYGPYSRSLSDTLQLAVSAGLLEESHEGGEDQDFTRYTYLLTEKAKHLLDSVGTVSGRFSEIVKMCGNYHWRALELAATVRFLELNEAYENRSDALRQALQLKPKTKDYAPQATKLLESL